MKSRIISAVVMISIGLPCLILGGIAFKCLVSFIAIVASYEIAKIRNNKLSIGVFIIVASYILLFCFSSLKYSLEPILLLCLFMYCIFDSELDGADASIYFMVTNILSIGINMSIESYNYHQFLIIYVGIASLVCDAGAYFIGSKFGKHKMIPRISPKKSWEGAIGGVIIGCLVSFVFASFFNYLNIGCLPIIISSIVLPVISEFGDLAFSLIKRHYGAKDYGNLIPGHGGVLDRFDSILFCLLLMSFIISFI